MAKIPDNEIDCVFRLVKYDKLSIRETAYILSIPREKVIYILRYHKPSINYESENN
jgi:hypothetical protein